MDQGALTGHIAARCPSNAAMFCRGGSSKRKPAASGGAGCVGKDKYPGHPGVCRAGTVESVPVTDIMLDTGASRSLVRRDLVPSEKMNCGEVSICCGHGDTMVYPLAQVEIVVEGARYVVEAAVAEKLPVSVLLGRDVPELVSLRGGQGSDTPASRTEAMAVLTQAQRRQLEGDITAAEEEYRVSGAEPNLLDTPEEQSADEMDQELPWKDLDPELFQGGRKRVRLTRSMKRAKNYQFLQEQARQGPRHPLDLDAAELQQLQDEDETLGAVRKAAQGEVSMAGRGFYKEDGLRAEDTQNEQPSGPFTSPQRTITNLPTEGN